MYCRKEKKEMTAKKYKTKSSSVRVIILYYCTGNDDTCMKGHTYGRWEKGKLISTILPCQKSILWVRGEHSSRKRGRCGR